MAKRFSPPPFTYDDKKLVGTGAFGDIYIGRLTESKIPICVKVCKDMTMGSFEAEFDLLAKLRGHDSIIQTYGFFSNLSMRCIVLEQASGSLEQLLNFPRHSEGLLMSTTLNLVGNLGKALSVLFKERIAHRDIKPMNILYFTDNSTPLGERYTFKLGDFGSGSVVNPQESIETYAGTWPYMAPQVLAKYVNNEDKQAMNAERTDLWSLGVTLFRCCTSKLPFDAPTAQKLLKIIRNRPENAISFCNSDGKYYNGLNGYHNPKWLNRSIGTLIQLLFQQANLETVAEVMMNMSKLIPRVAFYLNDYEFYETHPPLWNNDPWFVEDIPESISCAGGLCFLEGHANNAWLQRRNLRESINDVTSHFLILWDYTRPIVSTGTELYISYDDYSNFLELSTHSVDQISAYVLKFISALHSKVRNIFTLADTVVELYASSSFFSHLGIQGAVISKPEVIANFNQAADIIHRFSQSLARIDDLRKDPSAEEHRKKDLIELAKLIGNESQRQKQQQIRLRSILYPMLYSLLPPRSELLVQDLQPNLWSIIQSTQYTMTIARNMSGRLPSISPTPAAKAASRAGTSAQIKNTESQRRDNENKSRAGKHQKKKSDDRQIMKSTRL